MQEENRITREIQKENRIIRGLFHELLKDYRITRGIQDY